MSLGSNTPARSSRSFLLLSSSCFVLCTYCFLELGGDLWILFLFGFVQLLLEGFGLVRRGLVFNLGRLTLLLLLLLLLLGWLLLLLLLGWLHLVILILVGLWVGRRMMEVVVQLT